MLEVEIKAALGGKTGGQIEEAAAGAGFTRADKLREKDVYFNGADRDFMKTDEALRLRSYENLTKQIEETVITYKGPKLDTVSNTRREYETQIGDIEVMENLLSALGYRAVFQVEKTRQEWILSVGSDEPQITLCLDEVEGLGAFLELETLVEKDEDKDAALDGLLAILDDFGISQKNLTRKSYLEMLLARAKESARG